MAVTMVRTPVAGGDQSHLIGFVTLELRLRAIRKRRMATRIAGTSSSALWIACFAVLIVIIGAGLVGFR